MPHGDKNDKEDNAAKAAALFAALYEEFVLPRTEASVGEARASKSKVPARAPKPNKVVWGFSEKENHM